MSALKSMLSHLVPGEREKREASADDRRMQPERRKADRRSNVYPLHDREVRLRVAARAAGFGVYDFDCQTGNWYCSPELKAMAGLPPGEAPAPIEQIEERVHPEDRGRFMEKLAAALDPRLGDRLDEEFRLQLPDGTVRWVKVTGHTFFLGEAEERHPLIATGIVADLTARRAAEQQAAQSRAELAGLIDAVIDAIISIDADQRIVLFNPAASRIFRCSAEEAIGSPLERFIPVRSREAHRQHVRRFAEGGVTGRTMGEPGVFSGLRADGEPFPIEASIARVPMDGQWRMTVILRDISKRKAAEEALRRSRQELELAVHGAAMGIWTWDMRTGAMTVSERCRELFGIPAGEPVSYERLLEALHPDERERTMAAKLRAAENRDEYNIEHRVVWPDGSVHWLASVGRGIYDENSGEIQCMSGVCHDITARKRGEETLQRTNDELERRIAERTAELTRSNEALVRSNLELQQFAYIAAHDLQTPLRSVMGFSQLFCDQYRGRLDSPADVWLEQLQRSAQRMSLLIQDLLAYSRVDSQGSAFGTTDMSRLFDEVVSALEASIEESGAVVTGSDLPVVRGDRTQLAQVLQHLITNAIKYRSDKRPEVRVWAERERGGWLFSVRDNGIGIAEKHREHIFEIFHRLHTQQEYPGTGIGLAICRRVIHRHGGRIWVESEPGKGSIFRFTLPDSNENPIS